MAWRDLLAVKAALSGRQQTLLDGPEDTPPQGPA
jgi:hypothetical protein